MTETARTLADDILKAADLDGHLWAVSISGPDDLVPVKSYQAALAMANAFNEWWAAHVARQGGLYKYDPHMWASPVIYRGTAESHAQGVANPSIDYVGILNGAPA